MNRELSHLSSEDVSNLVLGESTPEMEQHAGECLHCFEQVKRLETSLALFRESGKSWADHWCSYQAAGAVVGRRGRAWVAVSVACAFAVAAIAVVLVFRQPPAKVASEQPFIALPYVAPPAPYERTEVLRMDVSVAMLMTAGLEVRAPAVEGVVRADVIVGQDGRALAVRLVPASRADFDRRLDYR